MSRDIIAWRHPQPESAQGRCLGARTDLPVQGRRAKKLARRIQATARRERRAHEVWTSPLGRSAAVGRWLRRWGWRHVVEPGLLEIDFGAWDGLAWDTIARAQLDAWVADFAGFAPAGGENLATFMRRVAACPLPPGALVVGHGGWMLARRWLATHAEGDVASLRAAEWGAPPKYGQCWRL